MAAHCDVLARNDESTAAEYKALAAEHRRMSGQIKN